MCRLTRILHLSLGREWAPLNRYKYIDILHQKIGIAEISIVNRRGCRSDITFKPVFECCEISICRKTCSLNHLLMKCGVRDCYTPPLHKFSQNHVERTMSLKQTQTISSNRGGFFTRETTFTQCTIQLPHHQYNEFFRKRPFSFH